MYRNLKVLFESCSIIEKDFIRRKAVHKNVAKSYVNKFDERTRVQYFMALTPRHPCECYECTSTV